MTNKRQTKVKHIIRIAAFGVFFLLLMTGIYWLGFRWVGLFILLSVSAFFSAIYLIRQPKPEKEFKGLATVFSCLGGCILLTFSILPGVVFPQSDPLVPTGPYTVGTTSVTLVDVARVDPFSQAGENRKLSVQFWYPNVDNGSGDFPLAVFSHGAFGYRGSNLSTFEELASNGYVVCSIDHSYHAFFAKHADGSTTFLKNIISWELDRRDAVEINKALKSLQDENHL